MTNKDILELLPYSPPFLFVDEIVELSENGVTGHYTYREDEYFYPGHFRNKPVTPGVILIETMAQIGLVCLGICLMKAGDKKIPSSFLALCSAEVEFLLPVFPGEKVTVISVKKYFRFNKLKCAVEMRNGRDELVCSGTLSGIIK